PRLGYAAARGERRVGVEDLANRSNAGVIEMRSKSSDGLHRACAVVWKDSQPGIDERPNQPGPDRTLMVRRVARTSIAVVTRLEFRVSRRERTKAHRRQQPISHRFDNWLPAFRRQHRVWQGNGENLIRPALGVNAAGTSFFGVDDVIKITAVRIPKTVVEGLRGPLCVIGVLYAGRIPDC